MLAPYIYHSINFTEYLLLIFTFTRNVEPMDQNVQSLRHKSKHKLQMTQSGYSREGKRQVTHFLTMITSQHHHKLSL